MTALNDAGTPSAPKSPRSPGLSGAAGPFVSDGPMTGEAGLTQPVLQATDIKRHFRIGNRDLGVLFGVNMDLGAGEKLGLIGASGAGKSTLLHSLGLLDRPSSGKIIVEGIDAWDLSPLQRARLRNRRIGFVFQMYHLLPELSAVENVILPGMIEPAGLLGIGGRKRRKLLTEKASELLNSFGLGNRLKHRPSQLSGGEKQRVSIARALILDPPIMIADEPTGNLDSVTGQSILDIIFAEQERRLLSLLLVTHDAKVADRCDRVLHMVDGHMRMSSEQPDDVQAEERTDTTDVDLKVDR